MVGGGDVIRLGMSGCLNAKPSVKPQLIPGLDSAALISSCGSSSNLSRSLV